MANEKIGRAVLELLTDGSKFFPDIAKARKESLGLGTDFEKSGQGVKTFGTQLSGLGTVAKTVFGAGVLGGITAIGLEYEKATSIIVKETGATGAALKGLQTDLKSVMTQVPQSADVVAEALSDLHRRLDLTGPALQTATKLSLDYARVNNVDVASATRTVAQLMNDLGISADRLPEVLDKLTAASQASGIKVDRLAELVGTADDALQEMGFGLDESIALFAAFEKAGAEPEGAIKALTKAMASMAKDGVTDAHQALTLLLDRIKSAPTLVEASKIAVETFGKSGVTMAGDIRSGKLEIDGMMKVLQGSQGTLERTGEASKTTSEKLSQMFNAVKAGIEPMGTFLIGLNGLPLVMTTVGGGLKTLGGWFLSTGEAGATGAVGVRAFSSAFFGPLGLIAALGGAALAFTYFKGTEIKETTDKLVAAGDIVKHVVRNLGDAKAILDAFDKGKSGQPITGPVTLDQAKAWEEGARAAGHLKTSVEDATVSVKAFAPATQKLTADQKAAKVAADALAESHVELSAGVKRAALEMLAQGLSADEVFKRLKDVEAITDDARQAIDKLADSQKQSAEKVKQHADEIKKLGETLTGKGTIKAIEDLSEAVRTEGINIEQLPIASLTQLNDAVEAGIDLYRRRGEQAPAALHAEALAIKAALEEAKRAQREYDALHGPVTFGPTMGVELSKIPAAKDSRGNLFEDSFWSTQQTLVSRSMTDVFAKGATAIDVDKVRRAAAARMKGFLGPGFWKSAFGSPQQFGAELSGTILSAIEGGGNVANAAGGLIGLKLGTKIGSSMEKSLTKDGSGMFQKALGGVFGAAMPVVGSLIGPLAAKLWNTLFGTAGRDAVKKFAQDITGSADLNALQTKLQSIFDPATAQQYWRLLTQETGRNNAAQAAANIKTVQDAIAAAEAKQAKFNTTLGGFLTRVKDLQGGLPASLKDYLFGLEKAGKLTQENIDLLHELAGNGEVDWHKIAEAVNRYGGDITKLAGSFQGARLHDEWQQLIDDLDLFGKGGISVGDILDLTKKKIFDLVQQSIKFGTEIPENMRPWIQSLIDSGELVDENGQKITDIGKLHFGETLQTSIDKLTDAVLALVKAFEDVTAAAGKVPPRVDTDIYEHHHTDHQDDGSGRPSPEEPVPPVSIGGLVRSWGIQYRELGGPIRRVFRPIGTDTVPAMLTPGELVLNEAQQGRIAAALDAALQLAYRPPTTDIVGLRPAAHASSATRAGGGVTFGDINIYGDVDTEARATRVVDDFTRVVKRGGGRETRVRGALGLPAILVGG